MDDVIEVGGEVGSVRRARTHLVGSTRVSAGHEFRMDPKPVKHVGVSAVVGELAKWGELHGNREDRERQVA